MVYVCLTSCCLLTGTYVVIHKLASHLALGRHVEIWVFILGNACFASKHHVSLLFCFFCSPNTEILVFVFFIARIWLVSWLGNLANCSTLWCWKPLEFLSLTLVLPFVSNTLDGTHTVVFSSLIYLSHSNFSIFFLPDYRTFLNWWLQVLLVVLQPRTIVITGSWWTWKIGIYNFGRTSLSYNFLRRTRCVGLGSIRGIRNSQWLVYSKPIILMTNSWVMDRDRIRWVLYLSYRSVWMLTFKKGSWTSFINFFWLIFKWWFAISVALISSSFFFWSFIG